MHLKISIRALELVKWNWFTFSLHTLELEWQIFMVSVSLLRTENFESF